MEDLVSHRLVGLDPINSSFGCFTCVLEYISLVVRWMIKEQQNIPAHSSTVPMLNRGSAVVGKSLSSQGNFAENL